MSQLKPPDLRIGNYVKCDLDSDVIFKVEELTSEFVRIVNIQDKNNWTNLTYEYLNGIHLSEEWLMKLGFDKTTPGYWSNGKLEIGYTTSDEFIQYEYICITHKTEMTDLKSVHQLQNLFYDLGREEIEINL